MVMHISFVVVLKRAVTFSVEVGFLSRNRLKCYDIKRQRAKFAVWLQKTLMNLYLQNLRLNNSDIVLTLLLLHL